MTQPFEAQLTTCLQSVQSTDKATRDEAEAYIQRIQEENWAAFIQGLTQELINDGRPEVSRQMAGLLLKNALDAKDSLVQTQKAQKWRALDENTKGQIRHGLLGALASQVSVAGHGAAMVVAKVARIDLLQDQWPNLLERIHQYIAPESPDTTREHALQCLGFICEEHVDATDRFPQQETNRILTSLVSGMAQTQPDRVRLAATKALCDAIEFASFNFDKEDERNYLMQTICEVMISSDAKIRLAAYQNVNKVLEMHYRYLERYISALYGLTTSAFRDSDDEVAMQAIEFWSTLAEIEMMYREEDEENGVSSGAPNTECKHFLDRCTNDLVPLLLDLLLTQEEGQDDSDTEWNKCMSATVCLINISRCVKDASFDLIKSFIAENVSKRGTGEEWRCREAALTAFGCLVDGPSRETLLPFVNEAFGFLLDQGLADDHPMVRRTTLWTLGRIFEHLHVPDAEPQLVTQVNVPRIVDALLAAMAADQSMAQKACYAVQMLADGFSPSDERHELTPYFPRIAEELLKVAYSNVPTEHAAALHVTAFEAMHTLITNSAQESIEYVTKMVPHFLQLIEKACVAVEDGQMLQKRNELQGQLCAALQVAIKRACAHPQAKQVIVEAHADAVMEAVLKVQATRSAVNDEVIMTMSVLCQEQGAPFSRYLPHVIPHIMAGLIRHEDLQVCRVCINAMGDIAREVTETLIPYADQIMQQLLANLQSDHLNRDVKPDILQVFGDMAQGLGQHFDRYIKDVVETLQAAMNIAYTNQVAYHQVDEPDEAIVLYNNELRGAVVNAAEGMLVSLPTDISQMQPNTAQVVTPFGHNLLRFIHLIHQDRQYADDPLVKSCVGLLGDLCSVPGMQQEIVSKPENKQWVLEFLKGNPTVEQRTLMYAQKRLQTIGVQ